MAAYATVELWNQGVQEHLGASTETEVHKHMPCLSDHKLLLSSGEAEGSIRLLQVFYFIRVAIIELSKF